MNLPEIESPKLQLVKPCAACGEESIATWWTDMRLCDPCGSDFMGSDEYEAAHQKRNALPWDAPEPERMAPYQQAARAWLARTLAELGRSAA